MRVIALSILLLTGFGTNCFAQSATAALSPEEQQFAALINQFRQNLNLPRLDIQPALQIAARQHSEWMDTHDFLTHYGPYTSFTPFQRMAEAGYASYYFAGENIACGNGDPVKTFRQWAFSPGHLQNMINPHFHEMGISRVGTGNERCPYYWTNDFGSYVDPATDPTGTSDLSTISQVISAISGQIPYGTVVSLTEQRNSSALPQPPAQIFTPAPVSSTVTPPAAIPTPTPTPDPNSEDQIWQRLYGLFSTSGVTASAQASPVSALQCLVPYALGKGILTYYANVDTFVEASAQSAGGYSMKLSYYQNGAQTNLYTTSMTNLTITRNPDFPIVTLFSAPATRIGGYTIQVNTRTNQAQFDSYGLSPGVTGSIMCNVQY